MAEMKDLAVQHELSKLPNEGFYFWWKQVCIGTDEGGKAVCSHRLLVKYDGVFGKAGHLNKKHMRRIDAFEKLDSGGEELDVVVLLDYGGILLGPSHFWLLHHHYYII